MFYEIQDDTHRLKLTDVEFMGKKYGVPMEA